VTAKLFADDVLLYASANIQQKFSALQCDLTGFRLFLMAIASKITSAANEVPS